MRFVITSVLSRATNAKLALWKQHAKVRYAIEGDENTRYFHVCANQRRRHNQIQTIEHNGIEIHSHEHKAAVLHDFYFHLLGSSVETTWNFTLADIYPEGALPLHHLCDRFEIDEIHMAVRNMNSNASPGPDGFGPLFFKASWSSISPSLYNLFQGFYSHCTDISRINRSYLVLLPKKENARHPSDFRPIALQNTTVKCISKVLTSRLQPRIADLISLDQSGFVLGRCLADNFVYAADLLNCCYKRCCPTIILKLDFHKAFDCVSWDSLNANLHHRGFPQTWCTWMCDLLCTGKTVVLLNGEPGRWINCKRGLRQGDPLSPYLFIIVADVLRRLLQRHALAVDIVHPVVDSLPCVVLQYADDTLIFLRASATAVSATKQILQLFESATGLAINYHKTTFLPIHVPKADADALASSFGTITSSFPQTYLGLPLNTHKVSVSDCLPLISSCDKYLSGWRASLLNRSGRLTLCTSVLSAVPLHYMSALCIPKTVIKAIEKRQRAFFWTGEDKCHGSKCLVAWGSVQAPKGRGGLGVKNLELQNKCLLMKFLNKFFSNDSPSWKDWILTDVSPDTLVPQANDYLWQINNDEMNTFRKLTYVKVNNGAATSFWLDHWAPSGPLFTTYSALFSHAMKPNVSVQYVFQHDFELHLRPRLTTTASQQLGTLLNDLQDLQLTIGADKRA